ncbi:MAG: hypothetical protein WBE78_11705, partial [Candidatus Binataceae bacterium]
CQRFSRRFSLGFGHLSLQLPRSGSSHFEGKWSRSCLRQGEIRFFMSREFDDLNRKIYNCVVGPGAQKQAECVALFVALGATSASADVPDLAPESFDVRARAKAMPDCGHPNPSVP